MKHYGVRVLWDDKQRYPRTKSVVVEATSVKAAIAKVLRTKPKGWRETKGASFIVNVIILERGKEE